MDNNKEKLIKLGSVTAKSGFKNEKDIANKFNSWKYDEDAQKWLIIMGYDLKHIEQVKAIIVTGSHKTDVQVQIIIYQKKAISIENLSVKLVNNPQGFNQIDKRWVDKYVELWDIPNKISRALKLFTGEIRPRKKALRDARRMFLDEMDEEIQNLIIKFFRDNKILIVADLLKGRDEYQVTWMMVVLRTVNSNPKWVLKHINYVLNYYGNGDVEISNRGSLKIGRITMQRKGGDGGRDTSKMLQFKINPVEIFK